MGLTKAQLEALNNNSFPNNNAGAITPDILRQYNASIITNTVNQDVYSTDSASFNTRIIAATGSGGGNVSVQDEGTILGTATSFNFTGAGVTATLSSGTASVTIPGGSSINTGSFVTTSSFNAYTASQDFKNTTFATTSSLSNLSASLYFTDTTQSVNITQASASAFGAFQSASSYSASAYQVDATQSFQITANALTASNSTTALSQSLYFTDTTQSANINSLTALTASTAYTNVANNFTLTQSFASVNVSGIATVYELHTIINSSSIVFSSGSNILGDEANVDTQTLIGRVIMSGSGEVTGSLRVSSDISSSTISGIGNVTLYSASVAASITGSSANVTLLSASIYQTDSTQSYQITANALTASNATTALSQSLFFTDTTQSVNITQASASAWGAFQSASAYSASLAASITGSSANVTALSQSLYFTDTTQSANINSLTALTASYATTGSNTFVGNQKITGSLTISSSLATDLVVIGRQIITGSVISPTGRTTLVGTSVDVNTTQDTGTGAFLTAIASTGSQGAALTLGVYDSPNFNTDIELNINVDTGSGIVFKDFDNVSAFDYVPFMSVAPNLGTNPAPVMTRGLVVTGSAIFTELTGSLASYSSSVNTRIIAAENTGYVTTASFNAFTQSTNDFTSSITASYNATSASLNSVSSSLLTVSGTVYTNTNTIIGLNAKTASYATTGSNSLTGSQIITGSLTITGSVATPPVALTISSNTASIDFSKGSIYTLTLVSSSVSTYITASNLTPGQTANLVVTQASALSGSIVWASAFKFPTGSAYTGSKVVNAVDLISFITVNNTTIYSVGASNLV